MDGSTTSLIRSMTVAWDMITVRVFVDLQLLVIAMAILAGVNESTLIQCTAVSHFLMSCGMAAVLFRKWGDGPDIRPFSNPQLVMVAACPLGAVSVLYSIGHWEPCMYLLLAGLIILGTRALIPSLWERRTTTETCSDRELVINMFLSVVYTMIWMISVRLNELWEVCDVSRRGLLVAMTVSLRPGVGVWRGSAIIVWCYVQFLQFLAEWAMAASKAIKRANELLAKRASTRDEIAISISGAVLGAVLGGVFAFAGVYFIYRLQNSERTAQHSRPQGSSTDIILGDNDNERDVTPEGSHAPIPAHPPEASVPNYDEIPLSSLTSCRRLDGELSSTGPLSTTQRAHDVRGRAEDIESSSKAILSKVNGVSHGLHETEQPPSKKKKTHGEVENVPFQG